MQKSPWWVHPALLMAGLLYGANYSIAKEVMNKYLEPYGLNLLRVSTAVVVFWIASFFNQDKIERSDYLRLALCAIFGASLNITLFLKGLSYTTPVNSSLILTTSPIAVLIASYFILKEKISAIQIIGISLGLAGAFLLLNTNELSFSSASFIGDLLVLINTISYSLYLVIVKPLMAKYHPFTILKWLFTIGFILIVPFSLPELVAIKLDQVNGLGVMALFYTAMATTVFAYFLNVNAIKYVSSTIVGYYIYLQPLFAGLIEVIIGRQVVTIQLIVSTSLIFLGVFLVSQKAK